MITEEQKHGLNIHNSTSEKQDETTIASDLNRLNEITERLKKVDVNKKLSILEGKIQKKNDELEHQIRLKQNSISIIEKTIYRHDLKYSHYSKIEDVQFANLGKIYKEDYRLFQQEKEQIGEQLQLEEEIDRCLNDAEDIKKKINELKWQRPPFSAFYTELMKHTGIFIKNGKLYIGDTINLRIAELNEENKELFWEVLAFNTK